MSTEPPLKFNSGRGNPRARANFDTIAIREGLRRLACNDTGHVEMLLQVDAVTLLLTE